MYLIMKSVLPLQNLEEAQTVDKALLARLAKVVDFLPNIEELKDKHLF
jgi:hypothetical protein